jgi:hypothetical protein
MKVQRVQLSNANDVSYVLLDEHDQPIEVVSGFMRHLHARGCSPNTLSAYAYDLLHFLSFLQEQRLTYLEFRPPHALLFHSWLFQLFGEACVNSYEIIRRFVLPTKESFPK